MKPFFSIILPVYNVAAYLEETLHCLRAQTFGDFEAFLVDDGSTDGSLEFCLRAAEEDARLHVLRTPRNGGAAAARNVALPEISGEYVTFLDSDDTFEPDLLAAYAEAVRQDPAADILKCGFFEEYIEDGRVSYQKACRLEAAICDSPAAICRAAVRLEQFPAFGFLWNGCYRASFLQKNGLRFDETLRVNEDFAFNLAAARMAGRLRVLPYAGYHYAKRANASLSTTRNDAYYEMHMLKIRGFLDFAQEAGLSGDRALLQQIFWLYARFCYSSLQRSGDRRAALAAIERDPLYASFCAAQIDGANIKQSVLLGLLRSPWKGPVLALTGLIDFTKQHFPLLFARIKR